MKSARSGLSPSGGIPIPACKTDGSIELVGDDLHTAVIANQSRQGCHAAEALFHIETGQKASHSVSESLKSIGQSVREAA
jgi:hypothetical protein